MIIRLVAALLLFGTSSVAIAQTAAQRAACEADAKKLCSGVAPGGGRMLDCLAKQKDRLTDNCKKVVESQGR